MWNYTSHTSKLRKILWTNRHGKNVCSLLRTCTILQLDLSTIYKLQNIMTVNLNMLCLLMKHWILCQHQQVLIVLLASKKYSLQPYCLISCIFTASLYPALEEENSTVCCFLLKPRNNTYIKYYIENIIGSIFPINWTCSIKICQSCPSEILYSTVSDAIFQCPLYIPQNIDH